MDKSNEMQIPGTTGSGANLHAKSTPDDEARREGYVRWIAAQLPACSLDELRVISVRVERMSIARAKYGPLDLSTDLRDWNREAAEENVDRAFYRDAALVARQDEARREILRGLDEVKVAPVIATRRSPIDFTFEMFDTSDVDHEIGGES